jgi:hypothetical protein
MSQYGKNRQAVRKTEYKKGINSKDAVKKREENVVQIRKDKRNESFQKRRNMNDLNSAVEDLPNGNLDSLVEMVQSNDPRIQIQATAFIRKLLSREKIPPIQAIIETGVLTYLVEFLKRNDFPSLQFEAAWALTNIASGSSEQTGLVIECGAVPAFRDLLFSPKDEIREQAVWALGNIAGDSPACRDFVLSHQIMEPLLQNLAEHSTLSMLRNATWTLSNLCRSKPQPAWDLVCPALPILAKLISSTDDEVLTDACWALSFLSDGTEQKIQTVIETGIARKITELMLHTSYSVQTPALRTVGNIVTGNAHQTQVMVNVSVLDCLCTLLGSPKKGIKKEACWVISNITAGNRVQIQAVIQAQIIPRLVHLIKNADFDTKREAAWALSNATSGGSYDQVQYMVDEGLIETMCNLLICADARIITVALESIENILKIGEKEAKQNGNQYIIMIEEAKGVDFIEALQNHPNNEIYDKAVSILETYFQAEEEYQNTAPNVNTTNHFTFDAGSSNVTTFHF